ncbi:MAG: hypothetical protein ACU0C9_06820 [Paracoccaceae bacterium]
MTHEEKNNLVSMIINILVNGYVIWKLFQMNAAGLFDGIDALTNWARMVVWVIPISIGLTIAATILFNIAVAIVTRDPKPSSLVDERDHMFSRRAVIATIILVAGGFIVSIVGLAWGWSALLAFNVIYFSFATGSFAGDLTKFISYRRGY